MAEWTRDQVLIALNLYCQLPFGRLHYRNPEIIEVAAKLGRTPGSLAMKLTNLASLDPVIVESGRKGLSGASALDRRVWQEFQENPEQVGYESQVLMDALVDGSKSLHDLASEADELDVPASYRAQTTTATVTVRVKQSFFRRAVILVTTAEGSHCAHYEGWAARSWSARLMSGYFRVMHTVV